MNIVPIRKSPTKPQSKSVAATQKDVDALALGSGTWRIQGIPGMYVRCRATSKSFFIQRRREGRLVMQTLGPVTVREAKEKAMRGWGGLKTASPTSATLGTAISDYIDHRRSMDKMAAKTEKIARYNTERYLDDWSNRTLERIGNDRAGIAVLHRKLTEQHGPATCNQVMRLLSAVYNWQRDRLNTDLPEWPRKVAELHSIAPRDWAYSPEELQAWWHSIEEKDDKRIEHGVKMLGPIKQMWWLSALFTGARKGSVEALKWADLDLAKKVIHFRVTKGNRPYSIPMSDALAELLKRYRQADDVPPTEWLFPSSVFEGKHLVDVKNTKEGVGPAHRLRHTYRTTLAELGASPDQARLLMGHSMGSDVSRGYITAPLLIESLRPITNAVAERYLKILGPIID